MRPKVVHMSLEGINDQQDDGRRIYLMQMLMTQCTKFFYLNITQVYPVPQEEDDEAASHLVKITETVNDKNKDAKED